MTDYKLTSQGDIDISDGNLQHTEPTGQHVQDLLLSAQGYYKENPAIGVDSVNYLMDSEADAFLRKVRKQCAEDGMNVRSIKISDDGELEIDAAYEND